MQSHDLSLFSRATMSRVVSSLYSITTISTMSRKKGKPNTTPTERKAICRQLKDGIHPAQIAINFNITERAVYDIFERYKAKVDFEDAARSGRPSKLTPRDIRHLNRTIQSNRRQSLGDVTTAVNNFAAQSVVPQTVREHLHKDLGYTSHRPVEKPYLDRAHERRRFQHAKANRHLTMDDFKCIIFTDECSVELGKDSSAPLVWRRVGERFKDVNLLPTFKSGRSSVHVWSAIAYNFKGPLVFQEKGQRDGASYIRNILAGPLWDIYSELTEQRGWVKVLEDGTPQHTCGPTQKWRTEHHMDTFPHPAISPDINAIENCWHILKARVNKQQRRPRNVAELREALKEEWDKIPISEINNIIESMPGRYQQLLIVKGGHINA